MIDFFNRTLCVILPRDDEEGTSIDNSIISDAIQSLMGMSVRTSITETDEFYNFKRGIHYKFRFSPKADRQDNNTIIHSLYTLIATLLLYYELDEVNVAVDKEEYVFGVDDLEGLKFFLDKILFDVIKE